MTTLEISKNKTNNFFVLPTMAVEKSKAETRLYAAFLRYAIAISITYNTSKFLKYGNGEIHDGQA